MLKADEIQRLKRMELWLRGLLVKYEAAWNDIKPDDQDGGSHIIANHFTPIFAIGLRAAQDSINYLCDLDDALEEVNETSNPTIADIREDTENTLELLYNQWQSIQYAGMALVSAWSQIGVEFDHTIPPATIEKSDEDGRLRVVDVQNGENTVH